MARHLGVSLFKWITVMIYISRHVRHILSSGFMFISFFSLPPCLELYFICETNVEDRKRIILTNIVWHLQMLVRSQIWIFEFVIFVCWLNGLAADLKRYTSILKKTNLAGDSRSGYTLSLYFLHIPLYLLTCGPRATRRLARPWPSIYSELLNFLCQLNLASSNSILGMHRCDYTPFLCCLHDLFYLVIRGGRDSRRFVGAGLQWAVLPQN